MKTLEEQVEEFYCEFSQIQFIKNERSGNNYKTMSDWLTQALKEAEERGRENERQRITKLGEMNWLHIPRDIIYKP